MEQKLVIRTETPPERCEICHQSDHFDPFSGQCSRCNSAFGATVKTEPLKGVQYANAPAAMHNRAARRCSNKNSNYIYLFSMFAFNALTGKTFTVSKALWGISFAAIAATYVYERYRPDNPQAGESPAGAKRGNKLTSARWAIFATGGSLAVAASIIDKGLDHNFIVAACLIAVGFSIDLLNKLYKMRLSKSNSDQTSYSQSDAIVKFAQSFLLTASIFFFVAGFITSGLSLMTVLLSIIIGLLAVFNWLDWNRTKKVQDKILPVQNIDAV